MLSVDCCGAEASPQVRAGGAVVLQALQNRPAARKTKLNVFIILLRNDLADGRADAEDLYFYAFPLRNQHAVEINAKFP
jgi:hypothetical protein